MSNHNLTDARWTKSSYSEPSGNCVELAAIGTALAVRDSKLEETSPILTLPYNQMQAFLPSAKGDEF